MNRAQRRTQRSWRIFWGCALMLGVGLALLSVQAWRLDADRREAQRRALLEERIRLALWRLDSAVGPLLLRESGRAHRDFTAPTPQALPPELHLRFALREDGRLELSPGVSSELQERFTAATAAGALEAEVPSPRGGGSGAGGDTAPEGSAQVAKDKLVLPELQSEAYQQSVSDNEFQRRVQNVQKSAPRYGGASSEGGLDGWLFGRARSDVSVSDDDSPSASSDADPLDPAAHEPRFVRESVMRAVWLDELLLLARRVQADDGTWIEGSWLDDAHMREQLREEIADLLPDASFEPVRSGDANTQRRLATLPWRLRPGPVPEVAAPTWSAMRLAIVGAWGLAGLVLIAAYFLLRATLALSERRGAFVSAVTHELRTPLTTFRMYTEMLSQGMVRDEAKRQSYLETLRGEALRLDQLVQNVLAYARIEDGRREVAREELSAGELIQRIHPRLDRLCLDRGARLELRGLDGAAYDVRVEVDVGLVEQILFNLVENAVKYGSPEAPPTEPDTLAPIELGLFERPGGLGLRVRDHGPGIAPNERERIFRPFEKAEIHRAGTLPGVGLGLALCKALAEELGGTLEWVPVEGPGAAFELCLPLAA